MKRKRRRINSVWQYSQNVRHGVAERDAASDSRTRDYFLGEEEWGETIGNGCYPRIFSADWSRAFDGNGLGFVNPAACFLHRASGPEFNRY